MNLFGEIDVMPKAKRDSKAYSREYDKNNREKRRAKAREYYKNDPEKAKKKCDRWRKNNQEKINNYYINNREKYRARAREYHINNREKIKTKGIEYIKKYPNYRNEYYKKNKEKIWARDFKKIYGITREWYNNKLVEQNNVCAICEESETAIHKKYGTIKSLAVDHCHSTGLNRGLLCTGCNVGGKLTDNPYLLRKKADYIESYL